MNFGMACHFSKYHKTQLKSRFYNKVRKIKLVNETVFLNFGDNKMV